MAATKPIFDFADISLNQVSLLIQIRYYIYHLREYDFYQVIVDMADIIDQLGYSPIILASAIYDDWNLQKKILARLDVLIPAQQSIYEDAYGPLTDTLDVDVVKESLHQGILSLRASAMLVGNPFSILKAERNFGLPETGNLEMLIRNWNITYYSPSQCRVYNHPGICFIKAIEYDDMENFLKLYPTINYEEYIQDAANTAARHGRRDMLDMLMQKPEVDWAYHGTKNGLIISAAGSIQDNTQMLAYLWQKFQHEGISAAFYYEDIFLDKSALHINNVKFFLNLPPGTTDVKYAIQDMLHKVAGQGWVQLFQELMIIAQPERDTLIESLEAALLGGHGRMVAYIRTHIELDSQIVQNLLYQTALITTDPQYKLFRYILSLPESDQNVIEDFLRDYTHIKLYAPNPIFDIIVEGPDAKMTRQRLERMLIIFKEEHAIEENATGY